MSILTTLARYKTYANISGSSQDTLISALLVESSAQIERYLRRNLTSTTYKVWLDGLGTQNLRLKDYPITAVNQVSVGCGSIASVGNMSSLVDKASVSFDGANLYLIEIATDGTEKMTPLSVATYRTIGTLQTAINLISGWSCSLYSAAYGNKASSFLRPLYAQDATSPGVADLVCPDATIPVKIVGEDMIEIINSETFPTWDIFPYDGQPNRMSAMQPGITPPTFSYGFPPGSGNVFVWFTAGYTMPTDNSDGTLPAGLRLLVHQITSDVLASTKMNGNIQSESIGDYSYTLRAMQQGGTGSASILSAIENHKRDLNQYRKVSI